VIIKSSSAARNWYLLDNKRDSFNVVDDLQIPNLALADITPAVATDFVSNGFKVRNDDAGANTSAESYIFMAFAENPFKFALAR
jgi:hypothetical protein